MICVPIVATTNRQARADMKKAAAIADLVELRLDYLEEPPEVEMLLDDRPLPVIVTNRPVREGGLWEEDETRRVAHLREAISLGAEYVDIEHDAVGRLRDRLGTRVIISYHNWGETPDDLHEIARMLVGAGGDIIKIATLAKRVCDNFRLCQLASTTGVATIVVGMGPCGTPSRILAGKFGSYMTFGALSREFASAPGQITASQLVNVYNYRSINKDTRVYGLIGMPVGHSVSPRMHNAAYRACSINAVYVPFEVDDFDAFTRGCRSLEPAGFSVTIPHKEAAFRLATQVDPVSRDIGAINTLRLNDDHTWQGTNTDCRAAVDSVKHAMGASSLSGMRVLLLGAGGAGRALAYGFASEGAAVTIANRTNERSQALAAEVGCNVVKWADRTEADYDILANATSLGMYPAVDVTPYPREALRPGRMVFDTVYNPRLTRLLEEARAEDCPVVDGLEMLVRQAAGQFSFWFDREAPLEVMRRAAVAGLDEFA